VTFFAENYTQSVEDFTCSLEVLKSTCPGPDRSVAETHYHIGVACVYAGRYDDGVTHFREAISILEAKNAALEKIVKDGEGKQEDDEVSAAQTEMKDIAELIPEIRLKVNNFATVVSRLRRMH